MSTSRFSGEPEVGTSKMAIASLAMGICSFVCAIFLAIPAIITGILALKQINKSQGLLTGSGMAIAGIVTGSLGSVTIPIVIALLLPAVSAARDAANRNLSMNNMKQIMLGAMNYELENGTLPPAGVPEGEGSPLSWRVHILPFIDHGALYEQFHLDEPWDSAHNRTLIAQMPDIYKSPRGDVPAGKTVYLAVTGAKAAFQGEPAGPRLREFVDGTSNTIVLVEADASEAVEWTRPGDWTYDPANVTRGLGGLWGHGFLAAMGDASVRFLRADVPPQTLNALMTRAGGEQFVAP